jgi:parallel beta-helix repeat protein
MINPKQLRNIMNNETRLSLVVAFLTTVSSHLSTCLAQGSLTPPGAPAPTMRTLLQIEPRTPISSLPQNITIPGSYFLTTNLSGVSGTNGITILTSNVVIDLRGFTLSGKAGAGHGVHVVGTVANLLNNIVVKNGTVSGWPGNGIDADNSTDSQFSDLNVTGNNGDGLDSGQDATVRHCIAANNGLEGFGGVLDSFSNFEDCDAHDNGDAGFYTDSYCSFRNCHANRNSSAGFFPFLNCTFQDCVADDNAWGALVYNGAAIIHCQFAYNGIAGIQGGDECVLRDSVTANNYGYGISVGDNCVVESCVASANISIGISVSNNCTLSGCAAGTNQLDNFLTLQNCTISHCSARGSVTGNGFNLGSGNTVTASSAYGNAIYGFNAGDRTTVQGCTADFNGTAGIHVTYLGNVQQCGCFNNGVYGIFSDANGYASLIQNNCSFNGLLAPGGTPTQGAGIYITNSPGCRVEGNTINLNYVALVVAANCHAFVLRNSAQGNFSASYSIAGGNSWGPIVNVSAGGDISGTPNSNHPDANFIH